MTTTASITRTDSLHVLIADDHRLVADALALTLEVRGFAATVAADPAATIELAADHAVDVVLLDLSLAGDIDTVAMIPALIEAGYGVIGMADGADREVRGAAIEAGADAVLDKSGDIEELQDALDCLNGGEEALSQAKRVQMLDELRRIRTDREARMAPLADLTNRERDVLRGMFDGLAADAIAERDFVSLPTIRTQIRGILRKLGVNSQLAAVAAARNAGWAAEPVAA